MKGGYKSLKVPYFSVSDKKKDKVHFILDERISFFKPLIDGMCFLPTFIHGKKIENWDRGSSSDNNTAPFLCKHLDNLQNIL